MFDVEPSVEARDSWLTVMLAPERVAVVGASNAARSPGGKIMRALQRYGYRGDIYPINPAHTEVRGLTCYPTIADVPTVPDVAVILVPAAVSVGVLEQCAAIGVRNVIVGSAGFAETGAEGREIQDCLVAVARRNRMRLIGPNTNGIVSCRSRFTATFTPALEQDSFELVDGPVAIVSQSGALGASFLYLAQRSGVPAGTLINTGNEVDVSSEEVIGALTSGHIADVILAYSEGVRDAAGLVSAARHSYAANATIAMLKVGTTADGAKAAAAHTASLAGEDRVFDGVARQLGIIRPRSSTELIDVGRILSRYAQNLGRKISVATMSGGLGVMITDAATMSGLAMAEWSNDDQQTLNGILPAYLSRSNPIDVAAAPFYNLDLLCPLLESMDGQSDTDISVLALCNLERLQESICDCIISIQPSLRKPLFIIWIGGEDAVRRLNSAGVPSFLDVEPCIRSVALVALRRPGAIVTRDAPPVTAPTKTPVGGSQHPAAVTVPAGEALLTAYGIRTVTSRVVSSPEEVVPTLGMRYPIVAKIESAHLLHKSDVGGVVLDLATPKSARQAVSRLLARSAELGLDDARVLLQEQVDAGTEMLVGMVRDACFGPVVTVGIGGVLAEAFDDVQFRLPVLDDEDIHDMLGQLKHQELLGGFRGLPAVDASRLAPLIKNFATLAREVGDGFTAIDLNPVMVPDDGSPPVAVDWLFVR